MYSLYHPVLTDSQSSVAPNPVGVGYQVLAAASDGQLTLTEITPKLEKADNDVDDDDAVVSTPELCEVQTSELTDGGLEMIVKCSDSA